MEPRCGGPHGDREWGPPAQTSSGRCAAGAGSPNGAPGPGKSVRHSAGEEIAAGRGKAGFLHHLLETRTDGHKHNWQAKDVAW